MLDAPPSFAEATYSPAHAQHVVVCRALEAVIVPSCTSAGAHADPTAQRRARELSEALNRIYGNVPRA